MSERDLDAKPYSDDEKRVAEWFFEKGTGGGDDPIGAMIASHEYLAAERNRMRVALEDISLIDGKRLTGRQKYDHAAVLAKRALTS